MRRTQSMTAATKINKIRRLKKHINKKMRGKKPQRNDVVANKKLIALGG